MKTKDLISLQKEYGDLKISEILSKQNRPFICPKCKGAGIERKIVRYGEYGYTNDVYENINCNICDGHGYTTKEMKPKVKTEIVGYE